MQAFKVLAVVSCLAVGTIGCGGGDSAQPPAPQAQSEKPSRPTDPIGSVAYDFLQAVVAGDSAQAMSLMTPRAIAQFEAANQSFSSPEIGAPDFRVGEVRQLDAASAAVQCLLQDAAGEAEMLCLLKRVTIGWRVSGVAYETSPNEEPVVLNFEQMVPQTPQKRGPQQFVQQPGLGSEPPRTAAETPPMDLR